LETCHVDDDELREQLAPRLRYGSYVMFMSID